MAKTLDQLVSMMTSNEPAYGRLRDAWNNETPSAFLSRDSRDALDKKIDRLSVNFPALVVSSTVERMKLQLVTLKDEKGKIDQSWEAAAAPLNFPKLSDKLHTLRQLYGAAYVTLWHDGIEVIARADSPLTTAADINPATGRVRSAARVWRDGDTIRAAYFTEYTVTIHESKTASYPLGDWQQVDSLWHGLGIVPVVPFIRETGVEADREDSLLGTSQVADILDLTAANSKALADAMVASEYFAKPRRWATGLEIMEDDEGNPIDPFGDDRFLQSEAPDTKFGQMNGSTPDSYVGLSGLLTQQIGALTGLPPHYLGLHGDQPASADAVRASESQLISRVADEIRDVTGGWQQVASVAHALTLKEQPLAATRYTVVWGAAETKNPGQAADVAVKLKTIGVPLRPLLSQVMDWEASLVDSTMAEYDKELSNRAAVEPKP